MAGLIQNLDIVNANAEPTNMVGKDKILPDPLIGDGSTQGAIPKWR